MNKGIWDTVTKWTTKHSPEILTGLGISGLLVTVVYSVKVTPKAVLLLEAEKKEQKTDKLKPLDTVKATWRLYLPSVVIAGTSIACIIGGLNINHKRNAALAAACSFSESALKTYQAKVIETIGENKEKKIRDAIAEDEIKKNPVSKNAVIITNKGETLCYDVISGRYFKFDIERLHKVEAKLNGQLCNDDYISLNEYYYEVGLDSIPIGDDLGWNISKGAIEMDLSSQLAEDETPCLVISFSTNPPDYNYKDLWR